MTAHYTFLRCDTCGHCDPAVIVGDNAKKARAQAKKYGWIYHRGKDFCCQECKDAFDKK